MIDTGDRLPPFELPDQDGKKRTFRDLTGKSGLILYVYPKDDTPGCTVEAVDFRDLAPELEELGYKVVGISKDGAESHCKFREKYDLPFPLLTDADAAYLTEIGAFGEKKMYGRVSLGIIRSTFVTDGEGTLTSVQRNVRAKGHAERVLRELRKD